MGSILFTELLVQMLKLGANSEVGDWLSVFLTDFGHGHVLNIKADGGTVRYQPSERKRK